MERYLVFQKLGEIQGQYFLKITHNKRNHAETQTFAPSSLRFEFWCCGRYKASRNIQ